MYYTSESRRAHAAAARFIGFAFLTVCTMASAYESFAQGLVPLFHHDDHARVFCTVPDGGACEVTAPLGLALADWSDEDGQSLPVDGWMDVAVANSISPSGSHGSVSLFRNTQNWPPNDFTVGLELAQEIVMPSTASGDAKRVAFGRLGNADEENPLALDLVVATGGTVYVYYYDTDNLPHYGTTPTFTLTPGVVEFIEGLHVADLDADGDMDIVVVGRATVSEDWVPKAEIMWRSSSSFSQVELAIPAPQGGWSGSVVATDVTSAHIRQPPVSGRLDLAITLNAAWLVRALNEGPNPPNDPSWDTTLSASVGSRALTAQLFRGSGNLIDVVVSNNAFFDYHCRMLWNLGSPNFEYDLQESPVYDVAPGRDPFGIANGLLNTGDSYRDVVVACQHGGPLSYAHGCVAVFRGYNDGTFNTTPHYFFVTDHEDENIAPKPCFVQVWDMNNDGLQDIVTSNNTADRISVLLQYPHNEEQ